MSSATLVFLLLALLGSFMVAEVQGQSPDVFLNITQIIARKGYPVETHKITTEDGYILTAFRIPYGKTNQNKPNKIPVILQHGLLDSSFTWVLNEPGESLSYILADNNYDVWLTNSRGNIYSTNHIPPINPNSSAYWSFSWDQMAKYDLPANIHYILSKTQHPKLVYIGHSQGTIQMFAALATNPSIAPLLYTFAGFGPVVSVAHQRNKVMTFLSKIDAVEFFLLFGFHDFLPAAKSSVWKVIFAEFCWACESCCANVIELICGPHNAAFNDSRMPVVATHEPGGTSVQNIAHWSQMSDSGLFQAYDYGSQSENEKHYNGSKTPPLYDLNKISQSLPIGLWSGGEDLLADPTDVQLLVTALGTRVRKWDVLDDYAHLDFAWAVDAHTRMYPQVLEFISEYTK